MDSQKREKNGSEREREKIFYERKREFYDRKREKILKRKTIETMMVMISEMVMFANDGLKLK